MNDKEKVWKKLADDIMQIDCPESASAPAVFMDAIRTGVKHLQEIFNRFYRLVLVDVTMNPNTFENVIAYMVEDPDGSVHRLSATIVDGKAVFREDPRDILEKEIVRESRT